MQKITPSLWFDNNAEEAVNFYVSVFRDAKAGTVQRYGDAGPGPKGSIMAATFSLFGQDFVALNGGPVFKFSEAVSFVVNCEGQDEVDYYWERLSAVPEAEQCGWLKDKFGLSWQIIPTALETLLASPDPVRAQRVMEATLKMKKIDIAELKRARDQA